MIIRAMMRAMMMAMAMDTVGAITAAWTPELATNHEAEEISLSWTLEWRKKLTK
jgi:uncharacterized protein YchJ